MGKKSTEKKELVPGETQPDGTTFYGTIDKVKVFTRGVTIVDDTQPTTTEDNAIVHADKAREIADKFYLESSFYKKFKTTMNDDKNKIPGIPEWEAQIKSLENNIKKVEDEKARTDKRHDQMIADNKSTIKWLQGMINKKNGVQEPSIPNPVTCPGSYLLRDQSCDFLKIDDQEGPATCIAGHDTKDCGKYEECNAKLITAELG